LICQSYLPVRWGRPQRKRETLFEALLQQLEAVAASRPVLMVLEDAHWIDPTSRELVDLMIDRVRGLPDRKPKMVAVAVGAFADPTFPAPAQAVIPNTGIDGFQTCQQVSPTSPIRGCSLL